MVKESFIHEESRSFPFVLSTCLGCRLCPVAGKVPVADTVVEKIPSSPVVVAAAAVASASGSGASSVAAVVGSWQVPAAAAVGASAAG